MKEYKTGEVYSHKEYMELSIREMMKSVSEHTDRTDPLVAAILVSPDGKLYDMAFRGELRKGDHAEFTLIERKNANTDLSDFTLYTTLEPCVKRNPPKKGCAFRTINARLSKVVIGHIDPDPTVSGNGIKLLQQAGIKVEYYDRVYEKQIADANKDFFAEAIERSKKIESDEITSSIDPIEDPLLEFQLNDLSEEAQIEMIDRMGLPFKIGTSAFRSYLNKMKLIRINKETNEAVPTGLGILLLGKNPEISFPQSRIKFTIRRNNSDPIIKDFKGPLVLLPEKIEEYLEFIFPKGFSRIAFERNEDVEISFSAILEVVMNSIVHRDYSINEARIMIDVDDDKIIVSSPGIPLVPLKSLNEFNAPSFSRNSKLAYIFFEMNYVEERGFGMEELNRIHLEYGLPRPIFELENNILKVTIFRNHIKLPEISQNEPKGLDIIKEHSPLSSSQYVDLTGVSERSARNHLLNLVKKGYATKTGKGPSTRYSYNGS